MRRLIYFLCLYLLFTVEAFAGDKPRIVKFAELEKILSAKSDTLYVINFWATWCAPCVKELPYFEEAKNEVAGKKVRILLVNLDFKKEFESRVVPFVEKKKLQNEVWFLDESNPNSFIDKVSTAWSGAIPFTLMYNAKTVKKTAYETSFTKQELIEKIHLNLE
ncbi:MAG: TlpA disulfide reductase family protein [Bacteroidia bacterium]